MIGVLLVWIGLAFSGAVSDGAEAFQEGDLVRATELWSSTLDSGQASGRVLFNLGNAWYRRGEHARAVACYRAAQRIRPRDGDIHHNLALARTELQAVPPAVASTWVWMALLTPGELSVLGLLAMAGGSALAVRWRRLRRRATRWAAVVGVCLGAFLGALAWLGHQSPAVAVVVDQEALVRDAPSADAGERHRLPVGAEVSVLRPAGEFRLIEDGRGRRGWVPSNAVFSPRP